MKRLRASFQLDIKSQFRNGFYYVSGFVALMLILILRQFPEVNWMLWWPVIILENLVVNTFYFMSGLVLLEKAEGTLEAQIVSPLRPWEYLSAKIGSLAVLSLLESLVIVVAVSGASFNWFLLVFGILCLVALYVLYGFLVVVRYDSIGEFILPSAIWTMAFSIPLLYYFNFWRSDWIFLHPLQAPLLLMQSAFEKIPPLHLFYAFAYSFFWIAIAYFLAQKAYHRFVVTEEGTR